jgi:flagella synthesis protein FlgN
MTSPSPLISLRQERSVMLDLVTLMREEQRHLMALNVSSLDGLTAHKSLLVTEMTLLANQRHALLAQAGFSADETGMSGWLAGCGEADAAALWTDLLTLTREGKELNRINGMLVNKQLAHTNGALAALRPAGHGNNNTYGPSGQTLSGPAKHGYVIG